MVRSGLALALLLGAAVTLATQVDYKNQRRVKFDVRWFVAQGDEGRGRGTDNAHITWHAGPHTHNQVHVAGHYLDSVVLDRGSYVISLNANTDALTPITCKINTGNKGVYKDVGNGKCHRTITITVP